MVGGAQTLDDILMKNVNNATDNTDTRLKSHKLFKTNVCIPASAVPSKSIAKIMINAQ